MVKVPEQYRRTVLYQPEGSTYKQPVRDPTARRKKPVEGPHVYTILVHGHLRIGAPTSLKTPQLPKNYSYERRVLILKFSRLGSERSETALTLQHEAHAL